MKFLVFFALTVAVAVAAEIGGEVSDQHHEVKHEFAQSHQSIKMHHFHAVPVYIKKEFAHLLKTPLEKGHSEHAVKQIHPKHEEHHGYGLVLEEHNYNTLPKEYQVYEGGWEQGAGTGLEESQASEAEQFPGFQSEVAEESA